jgi:hypothetical protein
MRIEVLPLTYSERVNSLEELLDYFTARAKDDINDPIVREYYHSRIKKYKDEYHALTGREYGQTNTGKGGEKS